MAISNIVRQVGEQIQSTWSWTSAAALGLVEAGVDRRARLSRPDIGAGLLAQRTAVYEHVRAAFQSALLECLNEKERKDFCTGDSCVMVQASMDPAWAHLDAEIVLPLSFRAVLRSETGVSELAPEGAVMAAFSRRLGEAPLRAGDVRNLVGASMLDLWVSVTLSGVSGHRLISAG